MVLYNVFYTVVSVLYFEVLCACFGHINFVFFVTFSV